MPKVSIIVPIYNAEKYLRKCIDSIRNQSLSEIEIILVNDGSIDSSLAICEYYQKLDSRIRVIDQPNSGVSSARNSGLKVVEGEFIGFIDPDDWIEKDMYESMYEKATRLNADVCLCDYIEETCSVKTPIKLNLAEHILNKEQVLNNILPNMLSSNNLNSNAHKDVIMGSVWRMLIKKELIKKYNLQFEIGIPLAEDLIFCVQVLLNSNIVCIDPKPYYHYILKQNTAVNSYRENMYFLNRKVHLILEGILINKNVYVQLKERMDIRYVNMVVLNGISNETRKENKKSIKDKIKTINIICSDKKLKNIMKRVNTTGYTIRKRLVLFGLKRSSTLFLYSYYTLLNKIS